jgi:RNA-binding protein
MTSPKKKAVLTSKQIRHLRGLGHHLNALVMIGQHGITENLIKSVVEVLTAHELVKIKIQNNGPEDRKKIAEELARKTKASLVQILGKTILLYKENIDKPVDKRIF